VYKKIQEIIKTSTVRQSLITTVSIFLSSGLGAVFYLVLARTIGPHDYGLFSLGIAALSVVMSVSDLGIGQGLVRFVGAHRLKNSYFPFVKLALRVKIVMGVSATIIFGLGSTIIARAIFHQPELGKLLPLVGLAVLFQLLFFLSASVFQGLQKFLFWGGIQVGANLLRLLFILPLLFLGKLDSASSFLVFIASYVVGFVVSLFWLDLDWLKSKVTPSVTKEFWDFNRWTAVFVIIASITARLDTILSGRFLSLTEVGIYSLAATMVSFLPQLASAIGAVTTAKFANIKDRNHEKTYLRKSLFFVGGISLMIALLMIPVALFVIHIAGEAYSAAFIPFFVLLVGNVIFLMTNPVRDSILYFHSKPKFFVFLSVFQGIAVFVSGLLLIPMLGVLGVALTVVVSQLVCACVSVGYYFLIKQ
jgi:O-antigen/teichoic acid export membrane protein